MAERCAGWLLRHRPPPFDISTVVESFRAGLGEYVDSLETVAPTRVHHDITALRAERTGAGVPSELAARSACWPWTHPGFDVVDLAAEHGCPIADASSAYWSVFEAFDLGWLWDGIGALPRSDRWETQARLALRDDLLSVMASLAHSVIVTAHGSSAAWIAANERSVGKAIAMHKEIRRAESFTLTTLSVALRQLSNLTHTTQAAAAPRSNSVDAPT
jgi:glutamate dehydrogenase